MIITEKLLFFTLVATITSAMATSLQLDESLPALSLAILAGVSSIVGAMYYRAHDHEGIATDLIITVIAALMIGISIGGAVGEWISIKVIDLTSIELSDYSIHIIGGGITGGLFTPLVRMAMNGGVARLLVAIQQFFQVLKGGKK